MLTSPTGWDIKSGSGERPKTVRRRVPAVALAIIPPWLEKLTSLHVSHSDLLAWWGAITGTIALGWNIVRHARPKGRLKVEGIYQADGAKPPSPPVFAVQVTNVGSKALLVQGIAIQLKKGSTPSHHFFPCETPVMLGRGKFFSQVIDRTGWIPTDAESVFAWDSSGKQWYLSRKQFRGLIDKHDRFITDEIKRVATMQARHG